MCVKLKIYFVIYLDNINPYVAQSRKKELGELIVWEQNFTI